MRRIISVCLCLVGFALCQAPSVVLAQPTGFPTNWWTNLPPVLLTNLLPDWTNHPPTWTNATPFLTNLPPAWTNLLSGHHDHSPWATNMWWTNHFDFTNSFPAHALTNQHGHGVIHPGKNPPDLPKDVQTLLQQFQQQRNQLANSLQSATDAQRQAILLQLSQMREQLQAQLKDMTQRNRDQIQDMRKAFSSHFAPGNGGGGPPSPGHGGKPPP